MEYDHFRQPVPTLSGGDVQRIVVARSIAPEPRLPVVFDPAKRLDVHGAGQVMHRVHERIAAPSEELRGAAIIRPDLEEVLDNCHRILILDRRRRSGTFDGRDLDERKVGETGSLPTGRRASTRKEGREGGQCSR